MKTLMAVVLVAIFGVVLYGVLDQHENIETGKRERDEQTLSECWQNAAVNGFGADVCKQLADAMSK
ncbi:MAG: hypothetical protein ABSF97_01000 [Candidatus Sulfotelmatobacter sp.]|jgi:hypothetical protein